MKTILVIPGDGIGPEVVSAAIKVLEDVKRQYRLNLKLLTAYAGDEAIKRFRDPLPPDTLKLAKKVDAILKGPVGESAADVIVVLRKVLGLYANVRPVKNFPNAPCVRNMDIVIVRENVEDVYVGAEYKVGDIAIALKVVTSKGTRRVAKVAAEIARKRTRKVTIIHKANVLKVTDGLFRDEAWKILKDFDIETDEMYIDAAAMEFVRNPNKFDVILTLNQYGDILSDLAAQISGSLGLAPSANIGGSNAIFEPVHGAAWDIAGKGIANPTAMILSAAMMLEWLGYIEPAHKIQHAIEKTLSSNIRTPDLGGKASTMEFAKEVATRVSSIG